LKHEDGHHSRHIWFSHWSLQTHSVVDCDQTAWNIVTSLSKEKQTWISEHGVSALRRVRVGVKKFRRCEFCRGRRRLQRFPTDQNDGNYLLLHNNDIHKPIPHMSGTEP
jgi:hypothetical protein